MRSRAGTFRPVLRFLFILQAIAAMAIAFSVGPAFGEELPCEPAMRPDPTPTPVPLPFEPDLRPDAPAQPTPTPGPGLWEVGDVAWEAAPSGAISIQTRVYLGDQLVPEYHAPSAIAFPTGDGYAALDGVLTFRGSNYRDRAAWGCIPETPTKLAQVWKKSVGTIDKWGGVGWTGQCAIVRWPAETRRIMNLYPEKRDKDGLTEVVYATLDGHIYFLDLEDGSATREAIAVGAPIKGSVSLDPRGYPLLYCGQGIEEVGGVRVSIGTRAFSLIDGSVLCFINGRDALAPRGWHAFDCSPIVDGENDTLLQLGENGVVYVVKLNTDFDPVAGMIALDPAITRYTYRSAASNRLGMENSLAVYNHYAYFGDNSGLLQCLDLETLSPVWLADAGDDTDSTLVIEEEGPGSVSVYTGCEVDLSGGFGDAYMRKFDALTGELLWEVPVWVKVPGGTLDAGIYATPALGKGELGGMIYYSAACTREGGTLFALDKGTGETVWRLGLSQYGWSSPVCVYTNSGKGYVLIGNSAGDMRLLDGLTGEVVCKLNLGGNIEGSPAVFDDMLVVGTRTNRILGIQIS